MKNESYIIYKNSEIDNLIEFVDEAINCFFIKANKETELDIKARYENCLNERSEFWYKFKSFIFYDVFKIFKKKNKSEFETFDEYKERVWKSFFRCNVGTTASHLEYLKQMILNAKKNNCDFEMCFSDHKILLILLDDKNKRIYSLNRND